MSCVQTQIVVLERLSNWHDDCVGQLGWMISKYPASIQIETRLRLFGFDTGISIFLSWNFVHPDALIGATAIARCFFLNFREAFSTVFFESRVRTESHITRTLVRTICVVAYESKIFHVFTGTFSTREDHGTTEESKIRIDPLDVRLQHRHSARNAQTSVAWDTSAGMRILFNHSFLW